MKKIIFLLIVTSTIFSVCNAYTKSFDFLLSTMQIERNSKNGYAINEDIYNAYNQFVYGNPLDITSNQRWKDVADGKWTKNGGIWNGSGTRGEYWVLGYNFSNEFIHNHQFPADIEPPTPPTKWRYVSLPDALLSWNDSKLYLHEEQKEYMQTAKLTRNNITYDITALDIGLDKAKAENYATWKTNGNIYTKRYDINNKEWAANFIVPPMAADAKLKSKLIVKEGQNYIIPKEETSISIPIEYGCDVINLTDYAKEEHVKSIYSEITLNDRKITSKESQKTTSIFGSCEIVINKSDYAGQESVELEICCNSILLTEFTADGALTDSVSQIITVTFEGQNKNEVNIVEQENRNYVIDAVPPHIDSVNIGREENGKIVPLKISKRTNSAFICAGQVLSIEIEATNTSGITIEFGGDKSIMTLDDLTKRFEWDEPKSRGVARRYTSLKELKDQYKGEIHLSPYKTIDNKSYFKYSFVVPYGTKQTLHSWSSLRELSKDAFNIDESKLLTRISSPYTVVIKAYNKEGVRTVNKNLDVFERWDTLYNRDLTPCIK